MTTDPLDKFVNDLPDYPGKTPPKNRGRGTRKAHDTLNGARYKVYIINGREEQMFTIGELAKALGKSTPTVRMWENRGWIPKPRYRGAPPKAPQLPGTPPKGRRLYTRKEVEFLIECVKRFKLTSNLSPHWDEFRKFVKTNWPN